MKALFQRDEESTRDLLKLVGVTVPLDVICTWEPSQIGQVEEWVGTLFLPPGAGLDVQQPGFLDPFITTPPAPVRSAA